MWEVVVRIEAANPTRGSRTMAHHRATLLRLGSGGRYGRSQHLPCERRLRLEELARQCAIRIRCSRAPHRKPPRFKAFTRRSDVVAHTHRTIGLYTNSGARKFRAGSPPWHRSASRRAADAVRHAQLQRRFAWLEELLERAPLGNSLAGQRERAPRELFDIKTDNC